jgi:hypothetical protein
MVVNVYEGKSHQLTAYRKLISVCPCGMRQSTGEVGGNKWKSRSTALDGAGDGRDMGYVLKGRYRRGDESTRYQAQRSVERRAKLVFECHSWDP